MRHTDLFVAFGGFPLKNTNVSSGGAGDHRVPDSLRRLAASESSRSIATGETDAPCGIRTNAFT